MNFKLFLLTLILGSAVGFAQCPDAPKLSALDQAKADLKVSCDARRGVRCRIRKQGQLWYAEAWTSEDRRRDGETADWRYYYNDEIDAIHALMAGISCPDSISEFCEDIN